MRPDVIADVVGSKLYQKTFLEDPIIAANGAISKFSIQVQPAAPVHK